MTTTLTYFLSDAARECGNVFTVPRVGDAGFDLRAISRETIAPGGKSGIHTGLHVAIPEGWVGLVRDRSSMAKRGLVTIAGVIDSSYRGEVIVLVLNMTEEPIHIEPGDRFAQMVVVPHLVVSEVTAVEDLSLLGATERGTGGFGSTGKK